MVEPERKIGKTEIVVFLSTFMGIVIISTIYLVYRERIIDFENILATMGPTSFIAAIIFAIPGAVTAPAGAEEISASASNTWYSHRSFSAKQARHNLEGYGSNLSTTMLIAMSGIIIAILMFILRRLIF